MNEHRPLTAQDEERLARYRAGAMSPVEREAFEHSALSDDALAEALWAEVALDGVHAQAAASGTGAAVARADVHVATSVHAEAAGAAANVARLPAPARRANAWRVALPLAAALAVVSAVGVWLVRDRARTSPPDVLRGAPGEARLVEPVGAIAAPPARLRWNAVAGAERYRVELYDAQGARLATAVTADTVIAIASLVPAAPAAGEWRVVPIRADGREDAPLPRAVFRAASAPR